MRCAAFLSGSAIGAVSTLRRCPEGGETHASRRRDPHAVGQESRLVRPERLREPLRDAARCRAAGEGTIARHAGHALETRRCDCPRTRGGASVVPVTIKRRGEADEAEQADVEEQQRDEELDEREAASRTEGRGFLLASRCIWEKHARAPCWR